MSKLKKYLRRKDLVLKRFVQKNGAIYKTIAPRNHEDEPLIQTFRLK